MAGEFEKEINGQALFVNEGMDWITVTDCFFLVLNKA